MRERFYTEGRYAQEHPTWHAEDSPWKATQIIKILGRNSLIPRSVVEIGFGSGEILNQLHSLMPTTQFIGYEISPQAYEIAKPKEKPRLQYRLGDLTKEEFFWDVLLCMDVVEHVEDYFSFLRSISGRAQYKIFHIPLELSAQAILRKSPLVKGRQHLGHIHYFTKETALASLNDCDYTIIDYFYTDSGGVNLSSRSVKQRLAWPIRNALGSLNKDLTARLLGGFSLLVLTR